MLQFVWIVSVYAQSLPTGRQGGVVGGVVIDPDSDEALRERSRERPSFGKTQVRDADELVPNRSFLEHSGCSGEIRTRTGKCENGCRRERIKIEKVPTRGKGMMSGQSFVIVFTEKNGGGWMFYLDSVSIEPMKGGFWSTTRWLERMSS